MKVFILFLTDAIVNGTGPPGSTPQTALAQRLFQERNYYIIHF